MVRCQGHRSGMPFSHLVGRFSLLTPSPWRRVFSVVALVAVLVTALPVASGTLAADPSKDPLFGRGKNDPIRLAKEQRNVLQDRIQNGQQKLTQLAATGDKLSNDLEATTTALDAITANLDDVEAQVNKASAGLRSAEAQQASLQQQVETLDWSLQILSDQADALSSDLEDRRRQLGARLADAYRATQPDLWEQVIGSGSFVSGIVQQQGSLALGEHDQELAASIVRDQAVSTSSVSSCDSCATRPACCTTRSPRMRSPSPTSETPCRSNSRSSARSRPQRPNCRPSSRHASRESSRT